VSCNLFFLQRSKNNINGYIHFLHISRRFPALFSCAVKMRRHYQQIINLLIVDYPGAELKLLPVQRRKTRLFQVRKVRRIGFLTSL